MSQSVPEMASTIIAAYVTFNRIPVSELPTALKLVGDALNQAAQGPEPLGPPATSVKKSVSDDFIICLEDGKKLRTLKRYLRTQYNLSPDEYRKKWGLPHDYPMVAPAYARLRSDFAKKIGLGRVPSGGKGKKR